MITERVNLREICSMLQLNVNGRTKRYTIHAYSADSRIPSSLKSELVDHTLGSDSDDNIPSLPGTAFSCELFPPSLEPEV